MRGLDLSDGFAGQGDRIYEALVRGHEGLTDGECAAMNARLVLLLANQVRDPEAVIAAIRLARETARPHAPEQAPSPP